MVAIETALGLEFPDDNSAIHNTISGSGGTTSNHSHHDIIGSSGGRNRAFSFECFAFGINADEPLPPLEPPSMNVIPMTSVSSSSNMSQKSLPNHNDTSVLNSYDSHNNYISSSNNNNSSHNNNNSQTQFDLPQIPQQRPRGDSIIFDPASFQDGGIHELLPGLIEQQQQQPQQQGHDFIAPLSSNVHPVGANIVPTTQQQYTQKSSRPAYALPQPPIQPLTSQPPTLSAAHTTTNNNINNKRPPPMVATSASSSTLPFTSATTASSAMASHQPASSYAAESGVSADDSCRLRRGAEHRCGIAISGCVDGA